MNTSTSTHPDASRLAAFVAGLLDAGASSEVEAHLQHCEVCGRVLEGLPEDTLVARLLQLPATGHASTLVIAASDVDRPAPAGYELGEKLGEGGMGVVFAAVQVGLNRRVALKMVRAERLASPQHVRR